MTVNVDEVDWSILDELQRDGRMSISELGRRINLSASATTERLRRLEAAGVITGYRVVLDLAKLGYPVLAVVWHVDELACAVVSVVMGLPSVSNPMGRRRSSRRDIDQAARLYQVMSAQPASGARSPARPTDRQPSKATVGSERHDNQGRTILNVGKPCVGEPHARIDGGSWKRGNLRHRASSLPS